MKGKSILLSLLIPILLTSLMATSTHAERYGSYFLWWDATVSGSMRYPGGTVCLESWFVDAGLNTTSYILSIDTISWTTPWDTYVETKTPVMLYPGDGFYSIFEVKIPDNQPTGNITLILSAMWRYRPTWERTWYAGNAILYKTYFIILPNPYILQEQVNSLNTAYEKLMTDYRTLNSSFNSLQISYNSLRISYDKLKADYDSLNASHTSLKVSYGKSKDDYDKLKSDYSGLKTQLESTTTQLKAKMDELTTNTNLLYVSMATAMAFVASTVYFARRKSETT